VPVLGLSVNVESQPPELAREIEMWLKADLPSPRLTGKVEG
jgi:hypothetical protein